jgi:hypothetical protein
MGSKGSWRGGCAPSPEDIVNARSVCEGMLMQLLNLRHSVAPRLGLIHRIKAIRANANKNRLRPPALVGQK